MNVEEFIKKYNLKSISKNCNIDYKSIHKVITEELKLQRETIIKSYFSFIYHELLNFSFDNLFKYSSIFFLYPFKTADADKFLNILKITNEILEENPSKVTDNLLEYERATLDYILVDMLTVNMKNEFKDEFERHIKNLDRVIGFEDEIDQVKRVINFFGYI